MIKLPDKNLGAGKLVRPAVRKWTGEPSSKPIKSIPNPPVLLN